MPLLGPPDTDRLKAKGDVPGLIKALGYGKDSSVRQAATTALVQIGNPAVRPLIAALVDANSDIRQAAIEALGQIGGPEALAALVHRLGFSAEVPKDLGPAALEAIRKIGDIDGLVGLLDAGSPAERCGAAFALGRLGYQRGLEALISVLGDTTADRMLRVVSANALADLGDRRAVEPLISALGNLDDIGLISAKALGRIGDPMGLRPVVSFFIERVRSVDLKGYLPSPMLLEMLVDSQFSDEVMAIAAFGSAAVDPLREALDQETDEKVRLALEHARRRVEAQSTSVTL